MIESLVERAWGCFFEPSGHKTVEKLKVPWREQQEIGRGQTEKEGRANIPEDLPNKNAKLGRRGRSVSESECPQTAMVPEALDEAFRQMLAELGLSEEKQRELTAQSREWKWRMLVAESEKRTKKGYCDTSRECEHVLRQLSSLNGHFPDSYELPLAVQRVEALAATLRTERFSFIKQFLHSDGLSMLVSLLNQCHYRGPSAEFLALPLLASIRALLNSTIGRQCVQESAETLRSIAWALQLQSARCKVLSLEVLSGLCVVADFGHRSVLRALTEAKALLGERTRFQRLVDDLHREHGSSPKETDRVRVAVMSLVNALLKSGPTEHSLEFRLHLRHEFLMLGILQVVERLRSSSPEGDGSALGDHLDLFEMMRQEDEQEMRSLSDSGSASPIDFESPSGMAEVLTQRLDNTLALPHLVSLFQHLLMVPADERHLPLWRLFDLVLQQLTLQSAMGGLAPHGADPQFGQIPLRLDMDDLLARLNTQQDYERLERKLRETEQELEGERRRLMELENRLSDLQDGVSLASFSRVSEHSASSSPSDPCHSPTPFCRSSALPPIRPPKNLAPPPPPPSALQLRSFGAIPSSSSAAFSSSISMKIVPKPKCTLKTLNWKQIPADQIQGTIWENIEDDRLYKQIDMEEICEQFVAGRGTGDEIAAEGLGTMQRSRPLLRQLEQISVVEPRRAQNCTIMLSRLKLSHREIRQIVLAMDERAKLPRDMIEQMLKFVPSKNELQLIREALSQQRKSPSSLALADRFLWEMGQIPRYDQRLKCLHTIRSFNECLSVLRPALNVVTRTSVQLSGSKRLRQFFALILAVGNILNHGKRAGNAFGFSVFSLDEIPTVRSSSRPERNLMHFLVELAEQKFPELLRLKRELGAVSEAAKVNRIELEAELHQLQRSIRELAAELSVHERVIEKGADHMTTVDSPNSPNSERTNQQQNRGGGDRFIPVVRAFLETANREMDELRAEHRAMAEKFSECARFFAATDPKKGDPSPDAFFCTFSRCFNTFAECYGAIWAEREELERTKRQTLARTVNSRKDTAKQRRKERMLRSDRDFESLVHMLQSGELFSEHLGRLRTSLRAANGKKRRTTAAGAVPAGGAFSLAVQSVMATG